jgi:hypothetical protein
MEGLREKIVHVLFNNAPLDWDENDIGILADEIMDVLTGVS